MSDTAWRVSQSKLRFRSWDDEVVVYHEESGDTHRLNAIGARALEHLTQGPLRAGELAQRLRDEFGATGAADVDFAATVDQLLGQLHEVGLVEEAERPPGNDQSSP